MKKNVFENAADIGENMVVLEGDGFAIGNKETGKWREIVSRDNILVVDDSEIDFKAIDEGCPDFPGGRDVDYYFGLHSGFEGGVCALCWTVYPDGRYFADEDGFGAEHNPEENAYCIINKDLKIIVPFQPMKDVSAVLNKYRKYS